MYEMDYKNQAKKYRRKVKHKNLTWSSEKSQDFCERIGAENHAKNPRDPFIGYLL